VLSCTKRYDAERKLWQGMVLLNHFASKQCCEALLKLLLTVLDERRHGLTPTTIGTQKLEKEEQSIKLGPRQP